VSLSHGKDKIHLLSDTAKRIPQAFSSNRPRWSSAISIKIWITCFTVEAKC
jgi:hypothetical protein